MAEVSDSLGLVSVRVDHRPHRSYKSPQRGKTFPNGRSHISRIALMPSSHLSTILVGGEDNLSWLRRAGKCVDEIKLRILHRRLPIPPATLLQATQGTRDARRFLESGAICASIV